LRFDAIVQLVRLGRVEIQPDAESQGARP
jgi:hypothetical protein